MPKQCVIKPNKPLFIPIDLESVPKSGYTNPGLSASLEI